MAALGNRVKENGRLKVCFIRSCKIVLMMQTFSLRILLFNPPRASVLRSKTAKDELPWARMREPVGLKKGCGNLPPRALPWASMREPVRRKGAVAFCSLMPRGLTEFHRPQQAGRIQKGVV